MSLYLPVDGLLLVYQTFSMSYYNYNYIIDGGHVFIYVRVV